MLSAPPPDRHQRIEAWLDWRNDSSAEGAGAYNVDVKQNTFTGRYHVTDEDTSWLDLDVNASYNGATLDRIMRGCFPLQFGEWFACPCPAALEDRLRPRHDRIDI